MPQIILCARVQSEVKKKKKCGVFYKSQTEQLLGKKKKKVSRIYLSIYRQIRSGIFRPCCSTRARVAS